MNIMRKSRAAVTGGRIAMIAAISGSILNFDVEWLLPLWIETFPALSVTVTAFAIA